ncbi:MAG: radical SAM protein, partial [Candidatus Bathyarchaeia archaeon]
MGDQSKRKTFFIYCKVHCPRRSLDSTRLYRYLLANGLRPVSNPKDADLIIVYTCGGFTTDEEFSLLTVKRALKLKSESADLVITGCLAKINPSLFKTGGKVHLIQKSDLGSLDALINAETPYSTIPEVQVAEGIHDLYHGSFLQRFRRNIKSFSDFFSTLGLSIKRTLHVSSGSVATDKTLYKLEIGKGCLNNCSYCAIKLAMDEFRSIPVEQIIANFRKGLDSGYKRFALLSADIGCYGLDLKTSLPSLLKKLFEVDGNYQIFLVDLNPRWFVKYYKELLPILKANSQKIAGVILPLQSGSDRILRLMRRGYQIDEVKACLLDLRRHLPDLFIETHIITGFPGETEEDFQKSVE